MSYSTNRRSLKINNKNRKKMIAVVAQIAVIISLSIILYRVLFITHSYQPLSPKKMTNTDGFIALSYFGVNRGESPKYITNEALEKQLSALKKHGIETISQQQVIDFYQKGTPLPKKALFLSFEDGRSDSSIFAQKTLEKLNYKATMFTYAEKMNAKDAKFLKPNHLKEMTKSGYWELGSNGNRLTYINAFNGNGEYLGQMNESNIPDKTKVEYYNHYLMDFIRDEYMIPKETRPEMQERITTDYKQMNDIYTDNFTSMPDAYALMHANTLYHNMHGSVESINERMIKKYFSLQFNRDLHTFNSAQNNIYDLNRLQVAPHWSVNHLLMKIQNDAKWKMNFEVGDKSTARKWSVTDGAGEFRQQKVILTSKPNKEVKATLHKSLPSAFTTSLYMKGGIMGKQSLYIASHDSQDQLNISLDKNKLHVYYLPLQGEPQLLFEQPLDEIEWSGDDYAFNKATNYDYFDTQKGSRIDEEAYPFTLKNNRHMVVSVRKDSLKIEVDHKMIAEERLPFTSSSYKVTLGGSSISSQNALEQGVDTIYDATFDNVTIQSNDHTIYTVKETKKEAFRKVISQASSNIIDFFIRK